ncbi:MAG: hypothetical protein VX288_03715 [Planctomycetota bacterium]|nr:hypothetical protein [Planctomycetota bacterium]
MMGNIIGTVKGAVAGLTGVAICLITLGVVMELLLGTKAHGSFMAEGGVVKGITGLVEQLGTAGLTGLISAVVILGIIKSTDD